MTDIFTAERSRSGEVLETETSIVILGDVNPGAQVVSSNT